MWMYNNTIILWVCYFDTIFAVRPVASILIKVIRWSRQLCWICKLAHLMTLIAVCGNMETQSLYQTIIIE